MLEKLKAALEQIAKLFTRAKMASSNLLPRFSWMYTEDIRAMEDSRKRVNRKAISLVTPLVGVLNTLNSTVRTQIKIAHDDGVLFSKRETCIAR